MKKDVVRQGHRRRRGGTQQNPRSDQVSGEDLDDADRQTDPSRDLGHRDRLVAGGNDHGQLVGPRLLAWNDGLVPDQDRLDGNSGRASTGAPTGHQVGPVVGAGLLVFVFVLVGVSGRDGLDGRHTELATKERAGEAALLLVDRLVVIESVLTVHSARFALSSVINSGVRMAPTRSTSIVVS